MQRLKWIVPIILGLACVVGIGRRDDERDDADQEPPECDDERIWPVACVHAEVAR